MKNNKMIKFYLIALVLSLFTLATQVKAADDDKATGVGYAITPVYPKTQIEKGIGYYYLETKPNEAQTFEVVVASLQKEPIKVKAFVMDGYTSGIGETAFGLAGDEDFDRDDTLINPVSELIKVNTNVVEVSNFEEKVVSFTVTPPTKSYDGVKFGQIAFESVTSEENGGVSEVYRYGVDVMLAESGDEFADASELLLTGVKPTVKTGKRVVSANLKNPQPKFMSGLNIVATITEKGKSKVVKERKASNFSLVPNSNVDFDLDWGLATLKAGEYTLILSAKNTFEEFNFKKNFKISGKQARDLNEESAFKIITPTWVKMVAIGNAAVVAIVSILVLVRNKKWQKLSKKRKKQKKNKKSRRK